MKSVKALKAFVLVQKVNINRLKFRALNYTSFATLTIRMKQEYIITYILCKQNSQIIQLIEMYQI